ncbi:hypothetical protein MTO96_005467 [Rhipicephalus appendiculatus]
MVQFRQHIPRVCQYQCSSTVALNLVRLVLRRAPSTRCSMSSVLRTADLTLILTRRVLEARAAISSVSKYLRSLPRRWKPKTFRSTSTSVREVAPRIYVVKEDIKEP